MTTVADGERRRGMSWIEVGKIGTAPNISLPLDTAGSGSHSRGAAAGTGRVQTLLRWPRRVAWTANLARPARQILAAHERIAIVADGEGAAQQTVELFDRAGTLLHELHGRAGAWVLDERGPALLGTSVDGDPTVWSLGGPVPQTAVWSTRLGGRVLTDLRVVGNVVIAVAVERRSLGGPLPNALTAVIQVPAYAGVSKWGTLLGTSTIAERIGERTAAVAVGLEPAGVVLASRSHVSWRGWDLQPRAELVLAGTPRLLSPRADGRIWMLSTGDGLRLHVLAPGRAELAVDVNAEFADAERLLVADDDGAVLVSANRIQAFDARGGALWKFTRDGSPWALIDTVGTTLFTHGRRLIATDVEGGCHLIWKAPRRGERLGPVCLDGDLLLVAAGTTLYALAPDG